MMRASRTKPRSAQFAPLGLAILVPILIPTTIGHQDLGALAAHAASEPDRGWSQPAPSRLSTIPEPTFRFHRPIGTEIPAVPPIRLASLGAPDITVTGAIGERGVHTERDELVDLPQVLPSIERSLKGDFLASRPSEPAPAVTETAPSPADDEIEAAMRFVPFPEYDISLSLE